MATAETSEKQEMDRDQKQIKSQVSVSPDTESTSMAGGKGKFGAVPKDRERKIGHRRVDESGTVTYKKKPTSELMAAIQLGIGQSVGGLSSKPERDLLMQDFAVVQSVVFPSEGSNMTPAHHYSDFRFKTYAPMAFRFFRELFNIRPDDFMLSLCDEQLTELSNPGAGGSIFYISSDDEFIIKTTQHKEANFLQKLLPGYYMNLNQNPRTTLPKFYGLYCYQCGGKNIRFCVMNNILPSTVKMHEKYDLKGSTYKRKASKTERAKSSPTLKDLDFIDLHPEGLLLEKDTYDALIKTIQRDCRVLESFKIMDYSLLVGIHNLDKAKTEKTSTSSAMNMTTLNDGEGLSSSQRTATTLEEGKPKVTLARGKSIRTKVTQYSTPMESIQADVHSMLDEFDDEDIPPGGIPAKNAKGERLLLYLGVIDILQYYRFRKKFEHTVKSMITDGDTVSVTRPSFYAERFLKFFTSTVFRKAPSPLKHSPSKRKGTRTISMTEDSSHPLQGTTGARPDLLMGSSTPPPTFAEATTSMRARDRIHSSPGTSQNAVDSEVNRSDRAHFQTIQQQEGGIKMRYSPLSVSESTPTYTEFTEGTPSYTASSPSCSSEVLDSHIPNLPLEKDAINTFQDTTDSPSRLMVASSSTEASYYSTVSHIDPGDGRETSSVIVTRSEERFSNTQNSSQVVEGKNKSDQNSTDVSNKSDINNPQYKDSYKANVTTVKLESTIGSKSVGEGYSETSWRKKDVSIVGGDSDQTNEKTPFNEVEESHQWWENREQEPPRHRGRGGLVPCFPISDKRITDSLITFIESGKGGLEAL